MKRTFLYILAALLAMSCKNNSVQNKNEDDKPVITVTIEPLRYFTEAIAGDNFNVVSMVPKGSSPETYDPTPQQLVDLAKSKAYFRIGYIGFEVAWLDKLAKNNPEMKIYDTSEGVSLLTGTHECHEEPNALHMENIDPHIWSSPKRARIIVKNMYDAFVDIDPDGKEYYTRNYEKLVEEINRIDTLLTHKLAPHKGEMFAIYHPSLSYLAHDYGLRQLSVELNGKGPSAFYMKRAVDIARENNVHIVFIQKEFNIKQALTFAEELKGKVVQIDPLNYEWGEELIHIADAFD